MESRRNVVVSKKFLLHAGIFALALPMLSGCANQSTASNDGSTTSQPAACGHETTTTLEGTGFGAAVGALAGGLLGHSGTDALIGGAAGAAVGTGAGYAVANKNCNQATTEADLQNQIDVANAETQRYQEDAAYYNSRAADAQEEAGKLEAEYKAGSLSAANYRARMATFEATHEKMQTELAQMQQSQQRLQQQAQAAGPNGGPLTQQAQQQASTQAQLQSDYDKVSNTLAEVPQG
jgi:hypothetical protein